MTEHTWITKQQLSADLRRLGVAAGQTLMVHSSIRAVGPVVGEPATIVQAMLDVLSPGGTLLMYVGWNDAPSDIDHLPEDERKLLREFYPPYDPRISRAVRDHGYLAECFRTWPGSFRSAHPDCSMVAVGTNAAWLVADHPLFYGYGPGSPLAKLCELGGSVLLLGAPLDTVTLLHYAEHIADLPNKRVKRYQCPILRDGQTVWVDLEEFETGDTVIDADYAFETIARDYLSSGKGRSNMVGQAQSYLFEAPDLAEYGRQWLEARFG